MSSVFGAELGVDGGVGVVGVLMTKAKSEKSSTRWGGVTVECTRPAV